VIDSLGSGESVEVDDTLKLKLMGLCDLVFGIGYTKRFAGLVGIRQNNGFDCGIHCLMNAEGVVKLLTGDRGGGGDSGRRLLPYALDDELLKSTRPKKTPSAYRRELTVHFRTVYRWWMGGTINC
jgi:hypothetical protein